MKRKYPALSVLTLGTAALSMGCSSTQPKALPNIIIVYADDVGYGDLSCNGATTVVTPNVERLAANGVRFTNAHTVAATSTPSRYGLLTGQYPWRKEGTGIAAGDAGMIISPDQHTLADMLRSAGYQTAAVGKWHLGLGETSQQDWNGTIAPGLNDIGFDYSFIMAATADRVPCVYIENQQVVDLDPQDPIAVSYLTPFEGEPTGSNNPDLLVLTPSHGHNQAIVNGIPRIGYMKGGKAALWKDEDIADRITDKALQFIDKNREHPFFLYFGTNDIHVPRVPHPRFAGKSGMGARGDAILSFDACLGRILDALDSLGIADNTLLIVSSDNGPVVDDGYNDRAVELLGSHRPWGEFSGGKYSAFEAGTRVPMIVRWPGHVQPGTVSDALLSHIDIYRSLGALCHATIPEGAAPDSQDNLATLLGGHTSREYIIGQNLTNTLSIIAGDWKYIEPSQNRAYLEAEAIQLGNNPTPQLYNLKDDPAEQHNLQDQYPQKTDSLSRLLEREKKL